MGCGCKKKKTQQSIQTPVIKVNQTSNETVQSENQEKIVDLIMEKLNSVSEKKSEE
jgi:hypothetical protein